VGHKIILGTNNEQRMRKEVKGTKGRPRPGNVWLAQHRCRVKGGQARDRGRTQMAPGTCRGEDWDGKIHREVALQMGSATRVKREQAKLTPLKEVSGGQKKNKTRKVGWNTQGEPFGMISHTLEVRAYEVAPAGSREGKRVKGARRWKEKKKKAVGSADQRTDNVSRTSQGDGDTCDAGYDVQHENCKELGDKLAWCKQLSGHVHPIRDRLVTGQKSTISEGPGTA